MPLHYLALSCALAEQPQEGAGYHYILEDLPAHHGERGAHLQVWRQTKLWRMRSCFSLGFLLVLSLYVHSLQH